jgi:hypothetical protein
MARLIAGTGDISVGTGEQSLTSSNPRETLANAQLLRFDFSFFAPHRLPEPGRVVVGLRWGSSS